MEHPYQSPYIDSAWIRERKRWTEIGEPVDPDDLFDALEELEGLAFRYKELEDECNDFRKVVEGEVEAD